MSKINCGNQYYAKNADALNPEHSYKENRTTLGKIFYNYMVPTSQVCQMVRLASEILHLTFALKYLHLKLRRSKTWSIKLDCKSGSWWHVKKVINSLIDVIINLVKLARQRSDSIVKDVLGNAIQTHPARIWHFTRGKYTPTN